MKKTKQCGTGRIKSNLLKTVIYIFLLNTVQLYALDFSKEDENMINEYIKSKNYSAIISFDASNIKQFWTAHSVVSMNNLIQISLDRNNNKWQSVPLKIQLANVMENQDCKIDIITDDNDLSFYVENSQNKTLSGSSFEEDIIHSHILSSTFHLEDTNDMSFNFKFFSNKDTITIKKIVLSFTNNKQSSFLTSPGEIRINTENCWVHPSRVTMKQIDDNSFSVTGKSIDLTVLKKFYTQDNPVSSSLIIKNIGNTSTRIYYGYAPYEKERNRINARTIPYNNNRKTLKVISSQDQSNSIIVDSYPEWKKNCQLALNVKEDFSDFPIFSFAESRITEIKKLDNDQAEIIFEKPITNALKPGTSVRVHSPLGAGCLFTDVKVLQPGEEMTISATIKKDDDFFQYSTKALCRGTYFIQPQIMSYSVDASEENTILISDYRISY